MENWGRRAKHGDKRCEGYTHEVPSSFGPKGGIVQRTKGVRAAGKMGLLSGEGGIDRGRAGKIFPAKAWKRIV